MHQTTVRFGADLWQALEEECERLGVSAAQYLREAALTRLVYAAGKRGDADFEAALDVVTGTGPVPRAPTPEEAVITRSRQMRNAQQRSRAEFSESAALAAQGRLARERAQMLRKRAEHSRTR